MSTNRAGEVWKEIKPFALRDLNRAKAKTGGGGGNTYAILLYDVGANKISQYDVSNAGLQGALGAAGSGDVVLLPACTISGDHTVPAGVALVGDSIENTVLTGQITLSSGSSLENLMVDRDENSASDIYGVIDSGAITAHVLNCEIVCANAGAGEAYAIGLLNEGTIYQKGGRAIGSVSLTPYSY